MAKWVIASFIIIYLSLLLLFDFSMIWIFGAHYVREPNRPVLIIETALMSCILFFGIYLLIGMMMSRK